ncbi:MAG TPA: PAS domain-containing protein, partial [Myxococcaceae bacterium]|nr:PAS domain-containing protein [Myxococcaceae bacterium]
MRITEASPAGNRPASPASSWLGAALGIGLATAFNVLVPGVASLTPYMAFHLVLPVVAWFSRSLTVAWVAVLVAALAGNVVSIPPLGGLTLTSGAVGAGLAFILIQGAFTSSVVLLRRQLKGRDLLLDRLQTERDRLLSLFDHAPIAVVTQRGPDLAYDFVSPGAQRLAQRPMLGRPMREVFPELQGQGLHELVERVYRTGAPQVVTEQRLRYRRDVGGEEEIHVDATYSPLRDERGRVDGVLTCAVDVTARVQARLQLERSEQQLRRLSEAGLLGIAEWRRDRIVGGNRRLLEMLGVPPDPGLPEGGLDWKTMTPPEFAEADARMIAELEAS